MSAGSAKRTQDEGDDPRYTARLLVHCADRPGIVAAISAFLFERGANIVSSHQYSSDPSGGQFFLRTEFFLAEREAGDARTDAGRHESLHAEFDRNVAGRFGMRW